MESQFSFSFILLLLSLHLVSSLTGNDLTAIQQLKSSNPQSPLLSQPGWNSDDADPCTYQGVSCFQDTVVLLNLAGIKFQTLPSAVFNMSDLFLLNVSGCGIRSDVPDFWNLGANREQVTVDLSFNNISSSLPAYPSVKLSNLFLNNNKFRGSIPTTISTVTNLWALDLSYNDLSGAVPSSLGSLTSLQTINLSHNRFSGALPSSLSSLTQLQNLDVSYNNFNGSFPNLGQSSSLDVLYAQGNSFSDLIPEFLKRYTTIANFTGSVFRCPIPKCQSGVQCVLESQAFACTCPCANLSYCVVDTPYCVCPSNRYGSRCESTCPGVSGSQVCNGNGNCSSGYSGNGLCTCNEWWGSSDCSKRCPGLVTEDNRVSACHGFGVCSSEGSCICSGNRTGVECTDCASGFAGVNCDIECEGGYDNPCNGHGDCATGTAGSGLCNCYDGWQGSACDKRDRNTVGLAVALAIIALALILLVLLVVYVKRNDIKTRLLYNKVDKKKDDPKVADYS